MVIRPSAVLRTLVAILLIAGGFGCGPRLNTGDLPEIRESGVLRVIVRPGFGEWPTPRGLDGVDERSFLEGLAARLGVDVEWIVAERNDDVLAMLREGRGDVALRRLAPLDLARAPGISSTATVDWVVDEFVSTQDGPIATLKDLSRATVALPDALAGRLELVGREVEVELVETVADEVPWEDILSGVASGRYQATIADSGLVESVRVTGRQLRVVKRLGTRRPLVWAVRESNPQLRNAIDGFLFAEKTLLTDLAEPACRDLREIRRQRVLRLATRNSPVTVTVSRGGLQGFEYDLALAFARDLGVRLELSLPPPGVDPVQWMREGYGDIAALHEPPLIGDPMVGRFTSRPYRWVDLVAVVASRTVPLEHVDDLAGLTVMASRSIASWVGEMPVQPPMAIEHSSGRQDSLAALVAVSRGEVYAAVVDADTARLELGQRPGLRGGTVVVPNVPLVWHVNPDAPRLASRVDRFLERSRRSGLIRQLERNHFGNYTPPVSRRLPTVPPGALTPYDEILKWAGRTNEIDWRLLASLMYEESRFDPDAIGPGGSAGLFQFMPFTWRELGVEDPHHPQEAAEAGARYLRRLMDMFPDLELSDRVAMAVASYNVGPRHVFDARRLAQEMGLDRDTWVGNVETAMLLLDDPEVAREYPAGVCRCRRAVGYTRRIIRRYRAYRAQFEP